MGATPEFRQLLPIGIFLFSCYNSYRHYSAAHFSRVIGVGAIRPIFIFIYIRRHFLIHFFHIPFILIIYSQNRGFGSQ